MYDPPAGRWLQESFETDERPRLRGGKGMGRGLGEHLRCWCGFGVGLGVSLRLGHADAEDVIDVADDGEALTVGELAVYVVKLLNFGASLGAGVAIFLVAESFASDARKDREETRVGLGVFSHGEGKIESVELLEELIHPHGSGFEGDLFKFRVIVANEFNRFCAGVLHFLAPFLL